MIRTPSACANLLRQLTGRVRLGMCLAAVALSASAPAGAQSIINLFGDGKPLVEPQLPAALAPPSPTALIALSLSPVATNRYAIDADSIAIDGERLVRYTLVVTSPSGARNISHEAIGCDRGQWMMLAVGRADGSWAMVSEPRWRRLDTGDTVVRHHRELFAQICQGGAAVEQNPRRIAERLRRPPNLVVQP